MNYIIESMYIFETRNLSMNLLRHVYRFAAENNNIGKDVRKKK